MGSLAALCEPPCLVTLAESSRTTQSYPIAWKNRDALSSSLQLANTIHQTREGNICKGQSFHEKPPPSPTLVKH